MSADATAQHISLLQSQQDLCRPAGILSEAPRAHVLCALPRKDPDAAAQARAVLPLHVSGHRQTLTLSGAHVVAGGGCHRLWL